MAQSYEFYCARAKEAAAAVRKNLVFNGVDCWVRLGICSMAHTDEDIGYTLAAFAKSLDSAIEDGVVPMRR